MDKIAYWRSRWASKRVPLSVTFSEINRLSKTEMSYLAGLIDGEGSFGIMFNGTSRSHNPVITIAMTHEETVTWVREKVGVAISSKKRVGRPNHRQQWIVRISGRRATTLAKRISRFMITKRRQAELFVEYDKAGWHYGGPKVLGEAAREALRKVRDKLRARIMDLNH